MSEPKLPHEPNPDPLDPDYPRPGPEIPDPDIIPIGEPEVPQPQI